MLRPGLFNRAVTTHLLSRRLVSRRLYSVNSDGEKELKPSEVGKVEAVSEGASMKTEKTTTDKIEKTTQEKKKKKKSRFSFPSLKLIPQPPGNIVGTVNDAVPVPPMDLYQGSYHWIYDRIVTATMTPLLVVPFVAGVEHPFVDASFSTLLLIHCRYGLQSCIADYIPRRRYGAWHTLAMRTLDVGSWVAFYGVYVIETEANGLFTLVEHVWQALSG